MERGVVYAAKPPDGALDLRQIPWQARHALIGIAFFLGLFILFPVPLTLPFLIVAGDDSEAFYASSLVAGAASEVGLVLVAAAMTIWRYGGGWEWLGVRRPAWRTLGWAAVAFIAAFALATAYGAFVEYLGPEALKSECDDQLPRDIIDNRALLVLAGIVTIGFAPWCEEVFFRGFVFPGLGRSWGAAAGIIISGVLFSAAHISLALHKTFVPILVIGLVFAYVYWRSGNIFSVILAHLAFNAISFSALAVDCPE
jgi:membrane protease YdiL (CAAX protease family)